MYPLQSITSLQSLTSLLITNSHFNRSLTCTNRSKPPLLPIFASTKPNPEPEPEFKSPKPKPNPRTRTRRRKPDDSRIQDKDTETTTLTIPRKPRRGRRSEAMAVEDYVRDSLKRTFDVIQKQNPESLDDKGRIMKDSECEDAESSEDEEEEKEDEEMKKNKKMVVEEESKDWPLDADVGWGIRASEYFEKHSIKNVVGEDGVEIDWEGEVDDNWVKEINCLEWESFAFHPSPLIVLVFERYNRATHNWRTLKELEKAAKVYWSAKDRLPPRTVKVDMNIEKDLAYALKAKECPQILFLRGNRIIHREKEFRTADELVQMIAHFYYNAKKPSCINDSAPSAH